MGKESTLRETGTPWVRAVLCGFPPEGSTSVIYAVQSYRMEVSEDKVQG